MFWNLQRLGATTGDARLAAIEYVYRHRLNCDVMLFCELLAGAGWPPGQNITYRKTNPYQLCYGAMDDDSDSIDLGRFTPVSTPEYRAAGFPGGNNFTQLCDRAVAYVGVWGGAHMYLMHAPANHASALRVLSFLVCDLVARHGIYRWIVIGDLNVPPDVLQASPAMPGGRPMGEFILESGVRTHWSRRTDRTLDYTLCNFGDHAWIDSIWISPRRNPSDHIPVVITY